MPCAAIARKAMGQTYALHALAQKRRLHFVETWLSLLETCGFQLVIGSVDYSVGTDTVAKNPSVVKAS